jgi:hypothetical protein
MPSQTAGAEKIQCEQSFRGGIIRGGLSNHQEKKNTSKATMLQNRGRSCHSGTYSSLSSLLLLLLLVVVSTPLSMSLKVVFPLVLGSRPKTIVMIAHEDCCGPRMLGVEMSCQIGRKTKY